ncbi:MAG: carbohydrate-binding domain-containing protein, partial [Firmicutes bacterium]|nr:carbohydrate-binding domain-containing protein [Bacillota bacterium]
MINLSGIFIIGSGANVSLYLNGRNYILYSGSLGTRTNASCIVVSQNATLTIGGTGNTIVGAGGPVSSGGIRVDGNLIINSGGFDVESISHAIGGDNFGSITINGGTIRAVAASSNSTSTGNHCAGIGGGGGNITINGGTVSAIGGHSLGAGIGSGRGLSMGSITINGGTVSAIGGYRMMGIGAAQEGSVDSITISGGVVFATGIGESPSSVSSTDVVIEGGIVAAVGRGVVATSLTQTDGILLAPVLNVQTDTFTGGRRTIDPVINIENEFYNLIDGAAQQAEDAQLDAAKTAAVAQLNAHAATLDYEGDVQVYIDEIQDAADIAAVTSALVSALNALNADAAEKAAQEAAEQLAQEKLDEAKLAAIAELEAFVQIVEYTSSLSAFTSAINAADTIDAVTAALVSAIDAIIEAVAPGFDTTVEGQLALAKSAAILQIEAYAALVEYEGSITPYLNAINNAGSIAFVA